MATHKEMLKKVVDLMDVLEYTAWEESFIVSIEKVLKHGGELNEKQGEKLEQIYEKALKQEERMDG